jgi:hypothetical protein
VKLSREQLARAAAEARTNLTIFHAVVKILEGGTLTAPAYKDAERIIAMCHVAAFKQLRAMDRALEEISDAPS